jgi:thioredoxin type arsenate reductase
MKTSRILFLCTGNSARSQIAEGLLRTKGKFRFEVYSAGIEPRPVNPLAVQVMNEIGIDISDQRSKDVSTVIKNSFDWVITVCDHAKQRCPIFPSARILHWDIRDPETPDDFRKTRNDLSSRIDQFLETVAPSNSQ